MICLLHLYNIVIHPPHPPLIFLLISSYTRAHTRPISSGTSSQPSRSSATHAAALLRLVAVAVLLEQPARAAHAATGGCHGLQGSRDSAFACRGVARAFAAAFKEGELGSSKAVVYQCPTGEYCGGWGDRLAGIFGAAALALYRNASFKVDWPDLRYIFGSGHVDWKYDPLQLGLSSEDQQLLQGFTPHPNAGGRFNSLGNGLAAFEDSNDNEYNFDLGFCGSKDHECGFDKILAEIRTAAPRIIYYSGNRAHPGWPASIIGLGFPYQCVFDALFAPTTHFLDSAVSLVGRRPRQMRELVAELQSSKTFSLAIHFRMHYNDGSVSEKTGEDYDFHQDELDSIAKHFECIEQLLGEVKGCGRKVLIVASDSATLGRMALKHFHGVDEVWVQNHTATAHIETARETGHDVRASLSQAMQMWVLIRTADMVVFGYPAPMWPSGFSMSASITAPDGQKRVYAETCQPITSLRDIYAGRF